VPFRSIIVSPCLTCHGISMPKRATVSIPSSTVLDGDETLDELVSAIRVCRICHGRPRLTSIGDRTHRHRRTGTGIPGSRVGPPFRRSIGHAFETRARNLRRGVLRPCEGGDLAHGVLLPGFWAGRKRPAASLRVRGDMATVNAGAPIVAGSAYKSNMTT